MATTRQARTLRKNLTVAEQRLWLRINRRQLGGVKFRRQQPLGNYIVDFICLERRLIVEVDGGQHAVRAEQDERRTRWLETQGFRVLRFWNNEVLENIDGVVQVVVDSVQPEIK